MPKAKAKKRGSRATASFGPDGVKLVQVGDIVCVQTDTTSEYGMVSFMTPFGPTIIWFYSVEGKPTAYRFSNASQRISTKSIKWVCEQITLDNDSNKPAFIVGEIVFENEDHTFTKCSERTDKRLRKYMIDGNITFLP